jgi:hypothetical protein
LVKGTYVPYREKTETEAELAMEKRPRRRRR